MKRKPRLLRNKWNLWKKLRSNRKLAQYQPSLCPYSLQALRHFLTQFETVLLTPVSGTTKKDDIFVTYKHEYGSGQDILLGLYRKTHVYFLSFKSFDFWLDMIRNKRNYLIQQHVGCIPMEGLSVRLRTIVQRNERNQWEVTGMFAKLSESEEAATKADSVLVPVETYFRRIGLSKAKQTELILHMVNLSLMISRYFGTTYRNRTYGYSMALDQSGKFWVLDVFPNPDIAVLNLVDKKMFQRALRLKRAARQSEQE